MRRATIRPVATAALIALALSLPSISRAAESRERQIPTEDALWRSAGEAFAQGTDKSAALAQYRLFVDTYGDSQRAARAQYMVAECYFAAGDHQGALREYREVKGEKGRDEVMEAAVLLRTAECQFNLGQFDQAIDTYKKLIGDHRDNFLVAEALYESGLAYIAEGNWLKLESVYRELLETRPGYDALPQVKFALGLFAYHAGEWDRAVEYFAQVPSDRGRLYWGRTLEEQGQYILAIQRYRQVLREYPDSPLVDDAAFSISEAFYRSGQNAVAVRSYREFLESYPDSPFVPNARYKLACVTYTEGRYDESIRQLEEVAKAFPDALVAAYARYLVGDCHLKLGRTADAIFAWTDVVKRFEQTSVASAALHKIVYTYAEEKNFGQAKLLADEFLRRYPGDSLSPRVRVLQGYAQLEQGEHAAAIRSFQNVLDKNVNTEVAERALFLSTLAHHQNGSVDRLVTNYNFISKKLLPTPSHWRARTYYLLGEAYYTQGLYRDSAQMYRLVLSGYPKSDVAAASLQGLVASYSQIGEYDLALEEQENFLRALANADAANGQNALAVGSIRFNQRDYEAALREYLDFLERNPDSPEAAMALANAGDCYYRLQYYEQAVQSWNDLIVRFPDSDQVEEALYRIADTQFGLGQFEEARQSYRRLEASGGRTHAADAAFGLANCSYNLGEDEAAIAAFTRFVETFPDDARVTDAELGIQSAYYRSGKDMGEYLARNPNSAIAADLLWNEGQEAFAAGEYARAAKSFERVTLDHPDSESATQALYYLAESYYRLDQNDPALAGFHNFASTHPDHDLAELARFRAGTVLYRLERYSDAAREYESLRDRHPAGEYAALALFNAAIAYQQVEDWTAAIASYEEFLASYPEHENAKGLWLEVAGIYQDELGSWDQAVRAYDQALQAGEGSAAEVSYRQGECHRKAGSIEAALQSFARGAQGGGDDPFTIASLAQMGELHQDRGEWQAALSAYERILNNATNPEWTAMAQSRVEALRQMQAAGR